MISFFVPGVPKPAGSKRVFWNRKSGKPIVIDDSAKPGADWRGDVKRFASEHAPEPLLDVPLFLSLVFYMQRPKSHFKKSGELRPDAPKWHTSRPDATKLLRSVEDALTGVLWTDDSRVVSQFVAKPYGSPIGVYVEVTEAKDRRPLRDASDGPVQRSVLARLFPCADERG